MDDRVDQEVELVAIHMSKNLVFLSVKLAVSALSSLLNILVKNNSMIEMLQWMQKEEKCKKIWPRHRKHKGNWMTWLREKDKKSKGNFSVILSRPNSVKI